MTASDEYTIFFDHVNTLTERRQSITTIYLSVNAALTTAIAFLFKDGQFPGVAQQASVLILLTSGIAACNLWRRLIKQYSILIGWWYKQLRALEDARPESCRLLTKEYQALYRAGQRTAAVGLTRYEVHLTWLFTILYILFGLAVLTALIQKYA